MHGSDPPVGWAGLNLEREVTVGGRPDKPFVLFCDALCPPCQDAVMAVLNPVLKPSPPKQAPHSHAWGPRIPGPPDGDPGRWCGTCGLFQPEAPDAD